MFKCIYLAGSHLVDSLKTIEAEHMVMHLLKGFAVFIGMNLSICLSAQLSQGLY